MRPGVELVDIGLPGIDGYEVARCVRRDPNLNRIALVALTGCGREEDGQRATADGFDYHFVKPLNPAAILGLMTQPGKNEPEKPPMGPLLSVDGPYLKIG